MNISHTTSNSRGFSSLTSCIASEHQSYDEQLPENRFTYSLYCKRTSVIRRATLGGSVHLPAALQANISHTTSNSLGFGSLTRCIAANISHTTSDSRGFGSLTSCIASRDQSYNEQLPEIRLTYSLYCSEHQSHDEQLSGIRFTYLLHCKQTSVI